jgi:hypothetical protein
MKITRFMGAGLGAGAVNLVLGFALAHLVGVETIQTLLRQHGLRVIGEPSDVVPHVVVRLLMGFAVTALFLCVAPRFDSAPLAALVAGAFAWAFVDVFTAWGHAHIGLFPRAVAWSWAGMGLVVTMATAFAGGWLATGSRFWE